MPAMYGSSRRAQTGAALLLFLLIITVLLSQALVAIFSTSAGNFQRDRMTTEALAQAREALIGYALTFPDMGNPAFVPGHLPCPDTTNSGTEGAEEGSCGAKGVSAIGYLPWKTLGLPPLLDGYGNCLWYAVSGSFKANPKADLLNWDSTGQFRIVGDDGSTVIAGQSAVTRPLAIIFSPGPPGASQERSSNGGNCGRDYEPAHFLDAFAALDNATLDSNAEGITTLAASGPTGFNDRLLWISAADLFARGAQKRKDFASNLFDPAYATTGTPALAQRLAECIAEFGKKNNPGRLPWAAAITLANTPPDTFKNDKFSDATNRLVGRMPFRIWNSRQSIGAANFTATWLKTSCNSAGSVSCRLLRTGHCPAGWEKVAGTPITTDSPQGWWDKWKDQFFYAVAEDFRPTGTAHTHCTAAKCLYVDGNGPYAALVIFSGQALPGQLRDTLAERNDPQNYLENENAQAIQNNNPADAQFGKFRRTGNDQFVCVKPDMSLDSACAAP